MSNFFQPKLKRFHRGDSLTAEWVQQVSDMLQQHIDIGEQPAAQPMFGVYPQEGAGEPVVHKPYSVFYIKKVQADVPAESIDNFVRTLTVDVDDSNHVLVTNGSIPLIEGVPCAVRVVDSQPTLVRSSGLVVTNAPLRLVDAPGVLGAVSQSGYKPIIGGIALTNSFDVGAGQGSDTQTYTWVSVKSSGGGTLTVKAQGYIGPVVKSGTQYIPSVGEAFVMDWNSDDGAMNETTNEIEVYNFSFRPIVGDTLLQVALLPSGIYAVVWENCFYA